MTTALSVVREAPALMPIAEVEKLAEAAAQSGLFPALKSKAQVMTLMMLCQSEGLHPMQALRRFDIIQGRVAMKADAILAEFQARGGTVTWGAHDHERCEATFMAPGLGKPVVVEWTMADARRAGLATKDTWRGYSRQMLKARVVSEGVRMAMPGVVIGLYTSEETADFDARPAVDYAPRPTTPDPAETLVGESIAVDDEPITGDMVDVFDKKTGELIGQRDEISNGQLARIHVLKKELEYTEEEWRTKLLQHFGKDSSAKLSRDEGSRLITLLETTKKQRKYPSKAAKSEAQARRATAVIGELAAEFTPEELERMKEPTP